jgi:hypothetical protein
MVFYEYMMMVTCSLFYEPHQHDDDDNMMADNKQGTNKIAGV